MIYAFKDSADGYYQVDIPEGADLPEWTNGLTPCDVHQPDPLPEPPQEPVVVTAFQARAALLQAGLLADVEAYMGLDTTDPFVKLAWDKAQDFRRDSPTVLSMIPILGLTEAQVDDLFGFAKTITA